MKKGQKIKHISWNVNGIRSLQKKGLLEAIALMDADILCFQEVKALEAQVVLDAAGYHAYWNPAEKLGYSGTLTLTRTKPIHVSSGLPGLEDREGRVQTLEYRDYYLVNVYTPNSKRDLSRLEYRQKIWDTSFLKYLKELEKKKPVVFCGDLNVAHKDIDLSNPKTNKKNAGFTPEERAGFENYISAGFVDTFRIFEKEAGHHTWWTPRSQARERNIGWRIDYFCVSAHFCEMVHHAEILKDIHGSDHCPVSLILQVP